MINFVVQVFGWGVVGTLLLLAVGWLFPSIRLHIVGAIVVLWSAGTLYLKGVRDAKRDEALRREEAVARAKEKYDEIDRRRTDDDDVSRRLSDGTF